MICLAKTGDGDGRMGYTEIREDGSGVGCGDGWLDCAEKEKKKHARGEDRRLISQGFATIIPRHAFMCKGNFGLHRAK